MSQIFLCSDLHLGHKKILEFEKGHRSYEDIESHDLAIRNNWNSVVTDGDTVIVLGDVAFNKIALAKLGQFKGKKLLVMGNHDKFKTTEYLFYFDSVHGALRLEDMILTHIPIHPDEMRWDGGNVHGHRHSLPQLTGKYFCVSLEKINMTPITLEEVKRRMNDDRERSNQEIA